jgi:isochorismate synthase
MISVREREDSKKSLLKIKKAVSNALSSFQSFSLWKIPGKNEVHLIVCSEPIKIEDYQLEEGVSGFAFAPFNPEKDKYLFPSQAHYIFQDDELVEGPPLDDFSRINLTGKENLIADYKFYFNESSENNIPAGYHQLVEKGLEEIGTGNLEKIVPSRFKDILINQNFNLIDAFETLCKKHSNALVSLVSSPKTGTWLGATPELLVSVSNDGKFKTNAIAGTLPFVEDFNLKNVAWTQKEIEEQALVCRYIINCFKKIRLREYEEHGPRTVVAGNVMHLKTDYEVDMNATNFPQLGSVMLKLLHPTSAVCGMPYENAMNFIRTNEDYDREFYSGYLGPVQIKKESHIFVNIRCMQIFQDKVRLYAGAGITLDSNPAKEYEETEIKMQNLQSLVNS